MPLTHSQTPRIFIGLGLWFAIALLVSALGLPMYLHPPMPQIITIALTVVLLLIARLAPSIRTWVHEIDIRYLVAVHLSRFVGAWFLVLYSHGKLPYMFAIPGGLGDIAVATVAAAMLLIIRPASVLERLYLLWNFMGLIDIIFVVWTAYRETVHHPDSMQALQSLPLSMLPLFLVPLIIATHILLFIRLQPALTTLLAALKRPRPTST